MNGRSLDKLGWKFEGEGARKRAGGGGGGGGGNYYTLAEDQKRQKYGIMRIVQMSWFL